MSALAEVPLLLSAVLGVLLIHPSMGAAAVDSLSSIAIMDPRLGVPLLLTIMFYSNLFTRNDVFCHDMLVNPPFCTGTYCMALSCSFVSFICNVSMSFFPTLIFKLLLQLKILEMLPSLASHSAMIPLVVQTILPMLNKDAKVWVLYWIVYCVCFFYFCISLVGVSFFSDSVVPLRSFFSILTLSIT